LSSTLPQQKQDQETGAHPGQLQQLGLQRKQARQQQHQHQHEQQQ